MRILNLSTCCHRGGGEMVLVAQFDLQITEAIRIYGMRLLKTPEGRFISYAPTALGGRRSVTFDKPTAEAITALALSTHPELVTADELSCKSTS